MHSMKATRDGGIKVELTASQIETRKRDIEEDERQRRAEAEERAMLKDAVDELTANLSPDHSLALKKMWHV